MAQNYSTWKKRPATHGTDTIMAKGQMANSSTRKKEKASTKATLL